MKLGEACFLKSGKNITAKEIYVSPKDNLYPCYGGNGLRGYVDKYNYEGDYNLIGRQGALCGNINRVNGKFYATEHAVVVTPLISLDIDWLYFALVGMDLNQYHTGAAQPGLNIDILNNLEIDVPIIGEQIAQATVLNKINGMIRNRKRELEKLDDLIKARFVEMFGDPKINEKCWNEGVMADFFEVKGGKRIPKGMDYSDVVTEHPYLRATDMKNETILDDDIHYIGDDVFQHIKRYTVQGGDIYLTNVGVNLGMAGVIPEKYSGANLTENAVKLVPKTDRFRGIFIANYINSPGIQEYIKERKMAVGVPKLAIFRIETMPLIIPPIEKQDEFAAFRAQVDKSKSHKKTNYKTNNKLAS